MTPLESSVSFAVDSHYFAEGRDDLNDHALAHSTIDLAHGNFSGSLWFAQALGRDYEEVNIALGYEYALCDELSLSCGLTHLRFYDADEESDDDELSLGLSYAGLPWELEAGVELVHSAEANGEFLALSVGRTYPLCEHVTLEGGLLLGLDYGYRTKQHDGFNHLESTLGLHWAVCDYLEIGTYVLYSHGLDDVEEEIRSNATINDGDENLTVAGVSATFAF